MGTQGFIPDQAFGSYNRMGRSSRQDFDSNPLHLPLATGMRSQRDQNAYLGPAERQNQNLNSFMYNKDEEAREMMDMIERVETIRARSQVNQMGNPRLLESLGHALTSVKDSYYKDNVYNNNNQDALDRLESNSGKILIGSGNMDSIGNSGRKTYQSNFQGKSGEKPNFKRKETGRKTDRTHHQSKARTVDLSESNYSESVDEEYMDQNQEAIMSLVNIEKSLAVADRLNDIKQDKRRLEGGLIDMSNIFCGQKFSKYCRASE